MDNNIILIDKTSTIKFDDNKHKIIIIKLTIELTVEH